MIGLLQRVCRAHEEVDGQRIAGINAGLLVLVGVQQRDSSREVARLLERVLGYRVFADAADRMNLSLEETGGELLLVPQFLLAADTRSGMRPSFTPAASPADGERLFDELVSRARLAHVPVACGQFAADMQVTLVNDGPVTFWLEVNPPA